MVIHSKKVFKSMPNWTCMIGSSFNFRKVRPSMPSRPWLWRTVTVQHSNSHFVSVLRSSSTFRSLCTSTGRPRCVPSWHRQLGVWTQSRSHLILCLSPGCRRYGFVFPSLRTHTIKGACVGRRQVLAFGKYSSSHGQVTGSIDGWIRLVWQ
jgi:hypothetical protein